MSNKRKAEDNREMARLKRAAGITFDTDKRADGDWRKQMASFPIDTRNLTARVFGDPLPGRSALDMRGPSISAGR